MFKDLSLLPPGGKIEKIVSFQANGNKNHFKAHFPLRDPNKKTAYVIGTGPSLKDIDMSKLKDKDTITFNHYIIFN